MTNQFLNPKAKKQTSLFGWGSRGGQFGVWERDEDAVKGRKFVVTPKGIRLLSIETVTVEHRGLSNLGSLIVWSSDRYEGGADYSVAYSGSFWYIERSDERQQWVGYKTRWRRIITL